MCDELDIDKVYKYIKSFVNKNMKNDLKDRHFDDCVQEMILHYLEGRQRLEWLFVDYLRKNGIGNNRAKQSAVTIEKSVFVGEDTYKLENNNEVENNVYDEFINRINDFLINLNLTTGAYLWALHLQKSRLLGTKRKKYSL